jgi:hypothetical protein
MASKNISAFEYVYPPASHPPAPPTRHSRAPRFHSLGFGQIPRPRWRFQPWTRPSPPHAWCTIPRFFCSSSSGRHRKWTNTGWFPSWPRVGGLRNWTEHYNFLIFRHRTVSGWWASIFISNSLNQYKPTHQAQQVSTGEWTRQRDGLGQKPTTHY